MVNGCQCWCWLCGVNRRHWLGRLDDTEMCGHVRMIVWFPPSWQYSLSFTKVTMCRLLNEVIDTSFNNNSTRGRGRLVWMECGAHTNPTKIVGLCCCKNSEAREELARSNLQLLLQPLLSQLKNVENPWTFAFLRVLWMHWNCWRIIFVLSLLDPLGDWTALTGISGISERTRGRLCVVSSVAGLWEAMRPAKGPSAAASWSSQMRTYCVDAYIIDIYWRMHVFQACQLLDLKMWQLRGQGLGTKLKKAEPVTSDDEDVLWQKGFWVTTDWKQTEQNRSRRALKFF